jgi:hypothetical protein
MEKQSRKHVCSQFMRSVGFNATAAGYSHYTYTIIPLDVSLVYR